MLSWSQTSGRREYQFTICPFYERHSPARGIHRDIPLVLEDLRKVRSDDIEAELARGNTLDSNKTGLMALIGDHFRK
jgi:hypothetical protein